MKREREREREILLLTSFNFSVFLDSTQSKNKFFNFVEIIIFNIIFVYSSCFLGNGKGEKTFFIQCRSHPFDHQCIFSLKQFPWKKERKKENMLEKKNVRKKVSREREREWERERKAITFIWKDLSSFLKSWCCENSSIDKSKAEKKKTLQLAAALS